MEILVASAKVGYDAVIQGGGRTWAVLCAILLGNGESHDCGLTEVLHIGHGHLDLMGILHVEHVFLVFLLPRAEHIPSLALSSLPLLSRVIREKWSHRVGDYSTT